MKEMSKVHNIIVSKPLDVINYKLSHLKGDFISNFIILNYGNNENYYKVVLTINNIFIDDKRLYIIKQISLYDFPFLESSAKKQEKSNYLYKKTSIDSVFKTKIKTYIIALLYTIIKVYNRLNIFFSKIPKNCDKLYLDPFPYKLGLVSLFKFKSLVFYDGGLSTLSYDYLNRLKGDFYSFLITFNSTNNRFLLDDKLFNIKKIKYIFYTSYINNESESQKKLQLFSECFPEPTKNEIAIVLGGCLTDIETIDRILKSNLLNTNYKKVFHKHPREIITKKLNLFLKNNHIQILKYKVSFEYDYLIEKRSIPSNIYHFGSSVISSLKDYDVNIVEL